MMNFDDFGGHMKQFEQFKWVRQGFLATILVLAAVQSHALTVRERYLLAHPEAKVEAKAEQPVQSAKPQRHAVKKHSGKRVVEEKATPVVKASKHRRSAKVAPTQVSKEKVTKQRVASKQNQRNAAVKKPVAKVDTTKAKHQVKKQAVPAKVIHHRKHHKQ